MAALVPFSYILFQVFHSNMLLAYISTKAICLIEEIFILT